MNKRDISEIILNKINYASSEDLYKEVAHQLKVLIENGNICVVKDISDNKGIVIIDFSPANPAATAPYPYWLYPDEAAYAQEYHNAREYEIERGNVEEFESDEDNQVYVQLMGNIRKTFKEEESKKKEKTKKKDDDKFDA